MQTFLPYGHMNRPIETLTKDETENSLIYEFQQSLYALDNKRLGKQRIEALDIYRIIIENPIGTSEKHMFLLQKKYGNHPIVKMWMGYPYALALYGWTSCRIWKLKGFKDTTEIKFEQALTLHRMAENKPMLPEWFGHSQIHESHRNNLIRKDIKFYQPKFCMTEILNKHKPMHNTITKYFKNGEVVYMKCGNTKTFIDIASEQPYIWYDPALKRCYWINKEEKDKTKRRVYI